MTIRSLVMHHFSSFVSFEEDFEVQIKGEYPLEIAVRHLH
jgi:hypothetical protein